MKRRLCLTTTTTTATTKKKNKKRKGKNHGILGISLTEGKKHHRSFGKMELSFLSLSFKSELSSNIEKNTVIQITLSQI